MRLVKRLTSIMLIAALSLTLPIISSAYDGAPPDSTDIIYIVDTSGSMEQTDSSRYVRDALKLGIDLAPENSRVAIIAVNTAVVSETDLTDVSTKEGRDHLKGYVDRLQNRGDTNFAPGFERALELLGSSYAYQKRVIFLGDFSEGGYNAGTRAQEAETATLIDDIAARAKGSGIVIDMMLWENAPQNSATAPHFLALPGATGGRLNELANPNRAPASIEDIYFQSFEYQYTTLSIRGEAGQALYMPMPTSNVRRARIYVSAQSPASAFGASYSGANLDGEQNRSYAMVDLTNPSTDGINITLSPGAADGSTIYTLLEYDPLSLSISATHNLALSEDTGNEVQVSTIHAEIVDAGTGRPILTAPYPDNAAYMVTISSSDGQVPVTYDPENLAALSFLPDLPEEIGTYLEAYQITAELTVNGITFGPFTASVDIPDIRPIPEPSPNWPLIIALSICGILILTALIIAYRIRKKEVEYQGAVEMASDYRFHGKLSVYAVMLDGGDREIRPFDFALHTIGEKRITLRNILDSVGAKDTYPGAEDILFLVGPEESVVVRNNSKAIIKIMGRNYEYRSKAQMFYGQKMYIVFEKDENELEINYRKVREEDSSPVIFNIQSRRAHAQSN